MEDRNYMKLGVGKFINTIVTLQKIKQDQPQKIKVFPCPISNPDFRRWFDYPLKFKIILYHDVMFITISKKSNQHNLGSSKQQ